MIVRGAICWGKLLYVTSYREAIWNASTSVWTARFKCPKRKNCTNRGLDCFEALSFECFSTSKYPHRGRYAGSVFAFNLSLHLSVKTDLIFFNCQVQLVTFNYIIFTVLPGIFGLPLKSSLEFTLEAYKFIVVLCCSFKRFFRETNSSCGKPIRGKNR